MGGSHQAAACHSRVWACHARVDGAICCLGDVICSSGNTRPYLGSCRPTLIFPFCHRYGRAINATAGTTSKYPHLLWIFHSSVSFSQLNKLSHSCKLRTSHTIIGLRSTAGIALMLCSNRINTDFVYTLHDRHNTAAYNRPCNGDEFTDYLATC